LAWSAIDLRHSVKALLHAGGLCSGAVDAATEVRTRFDFLLGSPFHVNEIKKALDKHADNLAALAAGGDVEWRSYEHE